MENNSPPWPNSHDPLSRSRIVLAVLEVALSILICLTSILDNLLVIYVVHNESTPKSLTTYSPTTWHCWPLYGIDKHALLGSVVRRPISANPWLNFNLGFFFFCSKGFSRIIFSILFRASNHQIVGKKNNTEFAFKLSHLNSNFALTPGYLNPALKNLALGNKPLYRDLDSSLAMSGVSLGCFCPEYGIYRLQTIY